MTPDTSQAQVVQRLQVHVGRKEVETRYTTEVLYPSVGVDVVPSSKLSKIIFDVLQPMKPRIFKAELWLLRNLEWGSERSEPS